MSLSPPPAQTESKPIIEPEPDQSQLHMNGHGNGDSNGIKEEKGHQTRESSGSLSPVPAAKLEPISIEDDDESQAYENTNTIKIEEQKRKYDEEEKKHRDLEPPPAERLQDDWQVTYVWAFIVKFNQKEKIRGLHSLEDFERCLMEPVALRPDDLLEGILIQFLRNLRPALRTLSAENVQSSLSNYITDQLLNSPEFTVWDRAWPANEEVRGGCCNSARDRTELGRLRYIGEPVSERAAKNPVKKQMDKGGGIFEMDWRDRAKLLRQLVDWQLTHCESVRAAINKENKVPGATVKKDAKAVPTLLADGEELKLDPLGTDRDKARIWSIDSSTRIYRSGNPYKRPCPLVAITQTRAEFDALLEKYAEHSVKPTFKPEGKGPKGKLTAAQTSQYKKSLKGKEDEGKVAQKMRDLIPAIEKEDARILRARKRVEQAAQLANMAEWRSTRTRRPTKKIDYSYAGEDQDYDEHEPSSSKRRRGEPEYSGGLDDRGRAIIPGERRSTRVAARDASEPLSGDEGDYPVDASEIVVESNGHSHAEPNGKSDGNGHLDHSATVSASASASGGGSAAASEYNGTRERSMDVDD